MFVRVKMALTIEAHKVVAASGDGDVGVVCLFH